jgi:hypothetical protein
VGELILGRNRNNYHMTGFNYLMNEEVFDLVVHRLSTGAVVGEGNAGRVVLVHRCREKLLATKIGEELAKD